MEVGLEVNTEKLSSFCFFSKNVNINIYRTIVLPVILYVCETWSLTLREEENNEELHNLYTSPNTIQLIISRRMRGAGHVSCMGGDEKWIQYFGWKT
jgi:hypothetical protein